MSISVVIPTLNSAAHLPRSFAPLTPAAMEGFIKEVIVADGGSTDDTLAMADAAGCEIVRAPAGRAKQFRAGVEIARANWLLLLHPDTALAPGWIEEAKGFLNQPMARKRAATFTLALDDHSSAARRAVFWARLRAKVMKLPYGEQGLLISRLMYDGLGGYPDQPAMEDVELARRIGAKRLVVLATEAVTSAETYRRKGYDKRAWRNITLMARYLMGADPVELAKAYD